MAHTILHWNGFDSGAGLPSDYPGSDWTTLSASYYSSFFGWSPFYGYGRFYGANAAGLRLMPLLPSSGYLAMSAQMLFGINNTGVSEATILRFWDSMAGAEQISFRITWNSGTSRYDLRIYRGATLLSTVANFCTGAVANGWAWISAMVYVHSSTGRIYLRTGFNDAVSYTFTGNTQNTANQRIDRVEVGVIGSAPVFMLDDLVISSCDPADDSMYRMRVLGAEVPTGSDMSEFVPVGAATNYQAVNEIPENGDTSYVQGSTAGQQDTYERAWPSIAQTIISVKMGSRVRKADAGNRFIQNLLKRGATVYAGPAVPVNSSYFLCESEWKNDPATGEPWRPDALTAAATKIGARIQ